MVDKAALDDKHDDGSVEGDRTLGSNVEPTPSNLPPDSAAYEEPVWSSIPEDAADSLPSSLLARYKDLKLLGEGGMGTVYRGHDQRLDRTVALKVLRRADPEDARRLLQEARSQARIQHDQVCRVYEVGEADGLPFIAMQCIEGESLDKAKSRMTLEQKVKVMREVAAALHEAHRLGMIHRDIKPANILIETAADGSIKPYLVDFGLARDLAERSHTMTGAVLGTPAYMAPEQARGEVHVLDRRTDVYSLGATLYDLLAGRPPFVAEHPWAVLAMVADEEVPPLHAVAKQIPRDLETIVMKCLEREPARRYDSVRAVGDDLQRFLDGEPVEVKRISIRYLVWRKVKKHRFTLLISCAMLIAVAIPLGAWIKERQDAAKQVVLARELGEDIKEMELFLRSAYQLPTHDVEKERDVVRARLSEIERTMVEAGRVGEGPGQYALGRGYLALEDPHQARAHLERALTAGYTSPELDYALGRALGEIYREELEKTKRIQNKQDREAKVREVEQTYRDPALSHLRASLGSTIDSPAYAEGLLALYGGKGDEALAKVKEASEKTPWLYEVKKLEGDVHYMLGSQFGYDAEFDWGKMMEHFGPAVEAYRVAADMARSDPDVHRAECELWIQIMNAEVITGKDRKSSFDKARQACTKSIAASSRDGRSRVQRALAYAIFASSQVNWSTSGKDPRTSLDEAIQIAQEAVDASPDAVMAHYALAAACVADVNYLMARGYDPRASLGRGMAAYETALRLDPQFFQALFEFAQVHNSRIFIDSWRGADVTQVLQSGIDLAQRAIQIDPGFAFAWYPKGLLHLEMAWNLVRRGQSPQQQVELATVAAEKIRTQSPGSPTWHFLVIDARLTMASYQIQAGLDPQASLDQVAQHLDDVRALAGEVSQVHYSLGILRYLQARYGQGDEKAFQTVLREAREAFQRAAEAAPWALTYPIWRARVEQLETRFAMRHDKATAVMFDVALAPLRPFLSDERANPEIYEVMAEIHALRAAWLDQSAKDPSQDIAQGLAMVDKALALNPHMATALAAKANLLLVQANAAKDPSTRAQSARDARSAFKQAFQNNPLLEREHADAGQAAEALAP